MKKILALMAATVLVVCCFAMTVSAADSPETNGVVSSVSGAYQNGTTANVKLEAEKVSGEYKTTDSNEVIIGQYKFEAGEVSAENPITVSAKIAGVKTTSKVYVLAKNAAGEIVKLDATVSADGVVEFKVDTNYTEVAFVADKQTATSIGVSDKTGDVTTPIVAAALVLSVVSMAVSFKKVCA